MAVFVYDGKSNLTAASTDTVILNLDTTTFTQAAQNSNNVVLNFGANALTITGVSTVAGLTNVSLAGGTFSAGAAGGNITGANSLVIAPTAAFTNTGAAAATTADSRNTFFGGLGQSDAADGNDSIAIGGKGAFLVYGNAGADAVTQTTGALLDSTTTVSIYGGKGADTVTLGLANTSNRLVVFGGEDSDVVNVVNNGNTTIYGGTGAGDTTDSADSIGLSTSGGIITVFGNAGNDAINGDGGAGLGAITQFANGTNAAIYGGLGNDSINLGFVNAAAKGSLAVYGGEGADTINVVSSGTTTIYGGNAAGSQSADSADTITFDAATGGAGGTSVIFGNAGNDVITVGGVTALDSTSTTTIYGGLDSDTVTVTGVSAKIAVYGGESTDVISVSNTGTTGTTLIYGGTGQGDTTDGADKIAITGVTGGTVNVFGNAGNDSITGSTTVFTTATTFADGTTANVYGGKGNDTINLGFNANTKGVLNVFGGEDTDTISVSNGIGGVTTVYGGTGQGDATDGADTISISGSGSVTAFGNGGADTINLGGYLGGSASTNSVTVYAGTGNDSINIGAGTASKTITVSGNEGNDTFNVGIPTVSEVDVVTVTGGLTNGQSITINGLVLTSNGGTPDAAAVTTAFLTGTAPTGTAFTGAATLPFTVSAGTSTTTLTYTNTSGAATNVAVASNGATIPTVAETTNGSVGTPGVGLGGTQGGITITDFQAGDVLRVENGIEGGGTVAVTVPPSGGFADLQAALNAATNNTNAGSVSAVVFGGSTYVVVNNNVAGFSATADLAIKLTGVTDAITVAQNTIVA